MLGAIAGDIIGSRFEGYAGPPRDFLLFHPACCFTDDTVCTLAVADALLGERDFAASLRAFVRRHPGRGYGGMFLDWALAHQGSDGTLELRFAGVKNFDHLEVGRNASLDGTL